MWILSHDSTIPKIRIMKAVHIFWDNFPFLAESILCDTVFDKAMDNILLSPCHELIDFAWPTISVARAEKTRKMLRMMQSQGITRTVKSAGVRKRHPRSATRCR